MCGQDGNRAHWFPFVSCFPARQRKYGKNQSLSLVICGGLTIVLSQFRPLYFEIILYKQPGRAVGRLLGDFSQKMFQLLLWQCLYWPNENIAAISPVPTKYSSASKSLDFFTIKNHAET